MIHRAVDYGKDNITDGIICFKSYPTEKVKLCDDFLLNNPDLPIVYVSSFSDTKQIDYNNIDRKKLELPFYEISSKSNYNQDKAIIYLLQKLTNHNDLSFESNILFLINYLLYLINKSKLSNISRDKLHLVLLLSILKRFSSRLIIYINSIYESSLGF